LPNFRTPSPLGLKLRNLPGIQFLDIVRS
jgi:hypothetical protein